MNLNENQLLLSPKTKAFICSRCGAVSLDREKLCEIQGMGSKADWCGIKHANTRMHCFSKQKHKRYRCKNCLQVALDPQLLCKPVVISDSEVENKT